MRETFESRVRADGDLAGVFENDGDTGFFYLYKVDAPEGQGIIDAVQVEVGPPSNSDVEVFWSSDQSLVGLQLGGRLVALFDCLTGEKYSRNDSKCSLLHLPESLTERLRS